MKCSTPNVQPPPKPSPVSGSLSKLAVELPSAFWALGLRAVSFTYGLIVFVSAANEYL
jgi:hypothetical protein